MSKKKSKAPQQRSENVYIYLFLLVVFLLTLINISIYLYPKRSNVLGISTTNSDSVFWYGFLQKHPNYIPGWLEIGRPDKVIKIDPNYF